MKVTRTLEYRLYSTEHLAWTETPSAPTGYSDAGTKVDRLREQHGDDLINIRYVEVIDLRKKWTQNKT